MRQRQKERKKERSVPHWFHSNYVKCDQQTHPLFSKRKTVIGRGCTSSPSHSDILKRKEEEKKKEAVGCITSTCVCVCVCNTSVSTFFTPFTTLAMSSVPSCIPEEVRRVIQADADCTTVYYCASPAAPPVPFCVHVLETAPAPPPSSSAPGVHYKLVYDVMRVHQHKVMLFRPHVDRIATSYRSVTGEELPSAVLEDIPKAIQTYLADPQSRPGASDPHAPDQNLKLMAWLSPSPPADPVTDGALPEAAFPFVLFFMKSFFPPESWYTTGTELALLFNAARENPNAKVVQANLRARAKGLQVAADVYEVLLVHDASDGYLIPEGSRSNYLLVTQDNTLLCSSAEDILIGITLKATEAAAVRAGLGTVHHRKLTLKDLCESRSCVMLGTSPGTLPVRQIVLYHDAESKAQFEAAAAFCGVDAASLKNVRVMTANPHPKAVLEFDVQNEALTRLRTAYMEESMA